MWTESSMLTCSRWILLLAATLLAVPARAHASCVDPEPKLLWSYPAPGEEVPTDAQFWLSTNQSVPPEVRLNGMPLRVDPALGTGRRDPAAPNRPVAPDRVRVDPGKLEPNTDYALELVFAAREGLERPSSRIVIPFRTRARTPTARAQVRCKPTDSTGPLCERLFETQDCFDDPGAYLRPVLLRVSRPDALAWIVATTHEGSLIWPATCGVPRLLSTTLGNACYDLTPILPGGAVGETVSVCPKAEKGKRKVFKTAPGCELAGIAPMDGVPDPVLPVARVEPAAPVTPAAPATQTSGCALGTGASGVGWVAAFVIGLLAFTRRRR